MPDTLTLLPTPRRLTQARGTYILAGTKTIALLGAPAQELLFSGERLRAALKRTAGLEWNLAATRGTEQETGVILCVQPEANASPESYQLDISAREIEITAPSARGIFYGVCTLIQIIEQAQPRLPALYIADAPDFPNRGVMWDISRSKVPTLQTLFDLVDLLASWKINQLQLYMEHAFAYRNHHVVWQDASPLTAQDILELDAYCRARYIQLVPNQNSFGHMHRWLKHEEYRDLAEYPAGFTDPKYWWGPAPFALNPTDPRSLALLRELYDELLPNFSSAHFNVGLDETFDLGMEGSKAEVEARGVGAVYLDFLKKIHGLVQARGKTMMFWGDIIINHPDLIPQLPRDVIAMEWGYEANHPFAKRAKLFAQAGIPFYVCPGTSSWISMLGRTENAIKNLRNAARSGHKYGAIGMLNTDWGDWGHLQFLPVSYLGLAYGAAVSWGVSTNRDLDIPRALDLFAFRDRARVMGRAAYELGNVYLHVDPTHHNASRIVRILFKSLNEIRGDKKLKRADFERALGSIDKASKPLTRAKMERADAKLIRLEYEWAARLARHGARRGLLALEKNPKRAAQMKRDLDKDLRGLIRAYKPLWAARNRPGGFEESVGWLEKMRDAYRAK